jgi:hypothetical protein
MCTENHVCHKCTCTSVRSTYHSTYVPNGTYVRTIWYVLRTRVRTYNVMSHMCSTYVRTYHMVRTYLWYVRTYQHGIMLCHNFLIGKGHTCTYTCTYVRTRVRTYNVMSRTYVPFGTYVRTYNVMSQLSDWKRAHMCTENHVCFGRIHGSQLREGANAGQHVRTFVT